ncbi:MAG: tetratricopeptide repeat protein [Gemmatimonadota bacterium]
MSEFTSVMAPKYKDVDEHERVLRVRTAGYAAIGAVLVFAAGTMLGFPFLTTVIATLLAAVAGYKLPLLLANFLGSAGASVYMAGGASTPAVREYSLADSLVARGRFDEAAEAYELLAEDHPDDPEPRVRLARLLRDRMGRPEDAATWLRKALDVKNIDAATELALLREISELYMYKLRTPNKALPYLRRLAEKHSQHPSANWARTEAAEIRQAMRDEQNG